MSSRARASAEGGWAPRGVRGPPGPPGDTADRGADRSAARGRTDQSAPAPGAEGRNFLRIGLRARTHPRKRRLRSVIATDQPGALPDVGQEVHRRLEQILEQPQLGIQRVEGLQRLRTVVAIPADELAHMGPVLLLHMRVVLFL